jgi:hypothetical protein
MLLHLFLTLYMLLIRRWLMRSRRNYLIFSEKQFMNLYKSFFSLVINYWWIYEEGSKKNEQIFGDHEWTFTFKSIVHLRKIVADIIVIGTSRSWWTNDDRIVIIISSSKASLSYNYNYKKKSMKHMVVNCDLNVMINNRLLIIE